MASCQQLASIQAIYKQLQGGVGKYQIIKLSFNITLFVKTCNFITV